FPMSHAEVLHAHHPAAGATETITGFVSGLRHAALSEEVRHYPRRHLFDTVGGMIAGAGGEVATPPAAVLAAPRPARPLPARGPRPRSTPRGWGAPPRRGSRSMAAAPRARCIPGAGSPRRRWPSATPRARAART